jgi:hypothetical protein
MTTTKNKPSSHNAKPSKEQLDDFMSKYVSKFLVKEPKTDSALPEMEDKIKQLMEELKEDKDLYNKFERKNISIFPENKQAYPNNDQYMYIPGQHNTQKWMHAVRELFAKEKTGEGRVTAIRRITSGWNVMETFDFLNWLKFYESGDHMKYKFAQLWYENGEPGYFLHIKPDAAKEPEPQVTGQDIDFARDDSQANAEKKQTIEKQRNKIIGRLDSAEKLLRSPDGQVFSGEEFETLLEAIYQLKKKIQMVNKVSTSTRLYEDMIVREANILNRDGFVKAASMLFAVAQSPGQSGEQAEGTPGGEDALTPASPGDPSGAGHPGAPGGLPSMGPGMPQNAPSSATPEGVPNDNEPIPESNKGMDEFLEGMETAKFSPGDELDIEDSLEVEDDELMVTEAQIINEPLTSGTPGALNPAKVAPPKVTKGPKDAPATEEPLEVTEDDIKPGDDKPSQVASDFDNKVNAVFANITIADVVAKLEDLAKFYKTREAPRQLGLVDMMLDSLGLASYFPSLAEATNKSLESNNYISTRVEDILSKLRGAMKGGGTDLTGGPEPEKPEVAGIKNKLKTDNEKEQARKQMRKEQEAAELTNPTKETPNVEIEEDLGAPKGPAPVAAKPAVPPG